MIRRTLCVFPPVFPKCISPCSKLCFTARANSDEAQGRPYAFCRANKEACDRDTSLLNPKNADFPSREASLSPSFAIAATLLLSIASHSCTSKPVSYFLLPSEYLKRLSAFVTVASQLLSEYNALAIISNHCEPMPRLRHKEYNRLNAIKALFTVLSMLISSTGNRAPLHASSPSANPSAQENSGIAIVRTVDLCPCLSETRHGTPKARASIGEIPPGSQEENAIKRSPLRYK